MQKTKFERLKKILPINIGDTVYYCNSDEIGVIDVSSIPFQCALRVIDILQAPVENEDCDPIFILYDPITNQAYVRLAVWNGSMILQTKELMGSPETCRSLVNQYVYIIEELSFD